MADQLAKGAHFLDEDKAQAAHARVVEQYGLTEASGDRYWRLKSAIYRSMGGRFEKAVRDPATRQIRQGMPPLPDRPPADPIARRIRHAVTHHHRGGVDLHKAETGGTLFAGIRQEEPHLCGPAAAQTLLAMHGIGVKQADLARTMRSTRRDGTTPENVRAGLAESGLEARIVQGATAGMVRAWVRRGIFPILDIQAWGDRDQTNDDAGHYVVAIAEQGDRIVLADPAGEAPMTLTDAELMERWHDTGPTGDTRQLAIVPARAPRPKTEPLTKGDGPAQLVRAAFARPPHPLGPAPARNRATFPYQGTVDFQGLKIRVENAAGSTRRGTSPDGTPWETRMRVHYGEFVATEGADGDAVDCFVGPGRFEPFAYVVHTQDPATRRYDEDKVMLGFGSRDEALAVFRAHYTGRGFVQSVRRMSIGELRAWLADPQNRGRKINGGDVLAKAEAFLARVRSAEL